MLLFKDKIPQSCLLLDLVDESMELVEQSLFLLLKVLVLLKSNLILPFDFFGRGVIDGNLLLSLVEVAHDLVMSDLSLVQALDLLVALVEWLNNLAVGFGLVHLLLLLLSVFSPGFKKLFVKLFDDVQILVSDNGVVVLDVVVLLVVLVGQLQDGLILLVLDLLDLVLSLFLHLGSQIHHLVFEFLVDFVGDTKLCLLLVFFFRQSIEVLLVTDFLLLFGNFE